jgi:hypothetical protein
MKGTNSKLEDCKAIIKFEFLKLAAKRFDKRSKGKSDNPMNKVI